MPRKKKRSSSNNKAPLIFTESPVNKQNNPPVPVYCSEHPQTASSIPVEELGDLTWVSPQFNQVPVNVGGKTRADRRRTHHAGTSTTKGCTCPHIKENIQVANGNQRRNKYKPLKFHGEQSLPQTVIEDVNITTDEEDNHNDVSTNLSGPIEKSPVLRRKIIQRRNKNGTSSENNDITGEGDGSISGAYFQNGNLSVSTPDDNCRTSSGHVEEFKKGILSDKCLESPIKVLFPVKFSDDLSSTDLMTLQTNSPRNSREKINPSSVIIKNLGLNTTINQTPNYQRKKPKILVADTPEAEYNIPVKMRKLRSRLINL